MDENRARSVFGTSKNEFEQESCRHRAEAGGRTLSMQEFREEMREELLNKLESELRKAPKQREAEFREWFKKWSETTKERERKRIANLLKPRTIKWPNR
jgi:hypothetical protein